MATERQPTRPISKVPQPRLDPSSSPPRPPRRKTQPLPSTERPTTRVLQKAGIKTGRVERNLTSRSIPKQSRPPNPMLIVGGIVGALFLMILIIAAAASSERSSRRNKASNDQKPEVKAEPGTLEREGLTKCDEGHALILRSYPGGDRAGLQRGLNLTLEGMSMLERVNQMTGKKFDVKRYQEAQVMARRKLMELQ